MESAGNAVVLLEEFRSACFSASCSYSNFFDWIAQQVERISGEVEERPGAKAPPVQTRAVADCIQLDLTDCRLGVFLANKPDPPGRMLRSQVRA